MRRYLVSTLLLCGIASADSRPIVETAKRELDRGLERFAAHDYATAIAAFDAGYAIDPHPDFLYAKAQAQRLGGDCRAALVSYRAFLSSNPPSTEAELARGNITKCEEVLAASAPTEPVDVSPTVPVDVSHVPPPMTPPPPHDAIDTTSPSGWWTDRTGWVLAGAGLVGLAVATVFVVQARNNADATASALTLDDWTSSHDAWQTDQVVAGIAAGVGAALVIGASIRFWSASRDRVVTKPTASGHGAVLLLEGSW